MTAGVDRLYAFGRRNVSLLSSMAYVFLASVASVLDRNPALAIGLLSFWHYYYYCLAYCFGAVPLEVFKRDAIAMKSVALIALALAYLAAPPDYLSLALVACGFLLNTAAARALGSDRTYYGHEVADLPRLHIKVFPYSWISHPMLLGNIAAFGGTLINAEFREQWWPLACAHMVLNLGLLYMETALTPRRRGAGRPLAGHADANPARFSILSASRIAAAGALLGGALGSPGMWGGHMLLGAVLGAGSLVHAFVMFCSYSRTTMPADERRKAIARERL